MLLALFLVGITLGGSGLSKWLWKTLETAKPGPAEQAASVITMTVAIWLGLSWALSLVHGIGAIGLVAGACAVGALGFWLLLPSLRGLVGREFVVSSRGAAAGLAAAAALPALWLALISWRGAILPPLNHDAFAYHLTKAVMIVREAAYGYFPTSDPRITNWPSNYEILLADVIALTHSDVLTVWLSGLAYVYFLALGGAVAERWWGKGGHVLGAILLAGSMPIALLHSGQHKNDLLMCGMFLGAILWTARWAAGAGSASLLLVAICLSMACGTKLHGLMACTAAAPILLVGLLRRWRAGVRPKIRWLLTAGGLAVTLPLLLGNATYLVSVKQKGTPFGVDTAGQVSAYGDWSNLWQFPYLAFSVPFAKDDVSVWVPWRKEYWFWARYDLFFSNYGAAVTLVLILVPFAIWRLRRVGEDAQRLERLLGTIMALGAFLLILPIDTQPAGFFASYVRYTMFIVPVIAAWSFVPWMRASFASRRWSAFGWVLLAVLGVDFGREAYLVGTRDGTAPLLYVRDVMLHPELRRMPLEHAYRAAFFVDRVAGATDHVVFDGDFDSWSYPAYGEDLTRRVTFLIHSADGPPAIPEDADWVVVDRSWNCFFGDPGFKDFGDWWSHLGHGKPSAEDVRVVRLLAKDPRFRPVYAMKKLNQVVFKRLRPGDLEVPAPSPEERAKP